MKVEFIPANKQILFKRQLIKKVAAYCRVSTDQEIQLRSLETQQEYYENLIKSKPGWEFVGIYADTASGLNNKKMLGFQDLMQDCRNGKIDLIINTPIGADSATDDSYLRKGAIKKKIPYITTMAAAKATASGMISMGKPGCGDVKSLQEWHSEIKDK